MLNDSDLDLNLELNHITNRYFQIDKNNTILKFDELKEAFIIFSMCNIYNGNDPLNIQNLFIAN